MIDHKYILEPYNGMNTRYHCPSCKHRFKTFSFYIDKETGEHIHPSVGRCNRESNCGYHYTPKQFFQDKNISFTTLQKTYKTKPTKPSQMPLSFISVEIFKASLKGYETNHFVKFLVKNFGIEITSKLISKYFIGTSKFWDGATVFWQIDISGKIRTGKIMLYSPDNGKRVKEPYSHINWVHKGLKQPNFELKQVLFGEHLLQDKTKPVALVESEKTAIIASVYLPQFLWLAVGSLNNLNAEKCIILKGRKVILFPDLNGFEKWSNKSKELSHIAKFTISNLLEQKATEQERQQGFDIADYLIKLDFRAFQKHEPQDIQDGTFKQTEKKEIEKVKELNYNINKNTVAYIDCGGILYIPTPLSEKTFTVYPTVESYNKRLCLPTIETIEKYYITEMISVFIDLKTLTINKQNNISTLH